MTALSRSALFGILLLAMAVLAVASLSAGKIWVPWSAWFAAVDDPRWTIVLELRLPRTVLAIAVGMALGASGAALQGYTRNPLADPGVVDVLIATRSGA